MSTRFGIVAALERELRPMTRRCARIRTTPDFAFFEFPDAVVVCGGIGKAAAARASEALVRAYQPAVLVSAGFAGAVRVELKVGDLLAAGEVLDVESGRKFPASGGSGVLATITQIADREQKALLAACGISAVDMEAAAVALTAQKNGLHFLALKAISDDAEFEMPPMQRFLSQGKFRAASFLAHVALRPAMWSKVRRLAASSARAAFVLSEALDTLLREGTIGKVRIGDTVRVDT
ncbi:MAG: phosphorylase [Acidobacteriales bacterium]|nr:phosphorylase [Terriglobales bacterium]